MENILIYLRLKIHIKIVIYCECNIDYMNLNILYSWDYRRLNEYLNIFNDFEY